MEDALELDIWNGDGTIYTCKEI